VSGAIRATFELEPAGSAEALALEESLGLPDGPGFVRGRVVSEDGGRAVLEFPAANWGRNVPMLVSALVAGEGVETRAFTRCRLVGLDLPERLLPGPAFGAAAVPGGRVGVGVIVKPSLGLRAEEVAAVAKAAAAGGAALVKDDELMGDPEWCPLEERVAAVASAIGGSGVVYCPNVTGPSVGVVARARRAVALGATGIMVNAFAQGLDAVLALRDADLGVTGAVLAGLLRECGADFVLVGSYGGKLFDSDEEVDAQVEAVRRPLPGGVRPSTVVLGGGVGPDNAQALAERAGGDGLLLLLGSRAYQAEGGLEASVRAVVEALG
jgi:ribulose 1,5-bisphosphate carboxylase large subunit-like protein